MLPEKQTITPVFADLKWYDLEGNIVKGETKLDSLVLSGEVISAAKIQVLYLILNKLLATALNRYITYQSHFRKQIVFYLQKKN